jgi:hypothetical protein
MNYRRLWSASVVALVILWLLPVIPVQALGENYLAPPFRRYYETHQGLRVLGYAQTGLIHLHGIAVQYFEKGRIEDHRQAEADGAWALMYGRLTAELIETVPSGAVNQTNVTYGDLQIYAQERQPPPEGFTNGTLPLADDVFVPYDSQLHAAPGYLVPSYFWRYINNAELFPGGWLHDIGLPLTNAVSATTVKDGESRTIMLQAFERTVLTYDPLNPAEWRVERGNIGSDVLALLGVPAGAGGSKHIEVDLARQWLYAYEGEALVYDAPVASGKDGFETPTGTFTIYSKAPLRTMRGSRNGETWEVPDVPHVMYFRNGGFALHGTYWHNQFGTGVRRSHGCVNLSLEAAALLYEWAPIGTPVIIYK